MAINRGALLSQLILGTIITDLATGLFPKPSLESLRSKATVEAPVHDTIEIMTLSGFWL
jgi:hypothetical protein